MCGCTHQPVCRRERVRVCVRCVCVGVEKEEGLRVDREEDVIRGRHQWSKNNNNNKKASSFPQAKRRTNALFILTDNRALTETFVELLPKPAEFQISPVVLFGLVFFSDLLLLSSDLVQRMNLLAQEGILRWCNKTFRSTVRIVILFFLNWSF